VYDLGEVEGTPYFVMSYADQGTVSNVIERKGRLPLDRTLSVVAQAGAGLAVLHGQGTIHRDVKPANLLLRTDGAGTRVMVADLGVAKAMMHASGLTHVVGTPAYMAPEQGTGGGLDARADVYALAAVTYHLLTGRVAHGGTIADLAHLEPPTPPSELAELPEGIDDVVLRGLAADREERWPDIASFVRAFQSMAPERASTMLVSPPEYRRVTGDAPAPSGSRLLLTLLCLAVFVACFVGALVLTQQLT
jgi:serine/threonine protein kinase